LGQKGTVAHPLDDNALSLVGNALAGERTRGGATTTFLFWLSWQTLWISRVRE
jgi:hypothetical protein